MDIEEQIRALKATLRKTPGGGSWALHNDLRHLYHTSGNHKEALRHTDAILGVSIMDSYMLSIVSGWQLDNPELWRILAAFCDPTAYKEFPLLKAACLVKAGTLCRTHGMVSEAKTYFAAVQQLRARRGRTSAALKHYQELAKALGAGRNPPDVAASTPPDVCAIRCSFCGKDHTQVKKIIAGPTSYICNDCVAICNDILAEDTGTSEPSVQAQAAPQPSEVPKRARTKGTNRRAASGKTRGKGA